MCWERARISNRIILNESVVVTKTFLSTTSSFEFCPFAISTTMDRELSNAALRDRFLRTAQRSQAALDQDESAAPEEAFPPKLPSLTDAKYHALRDDRGNRHFFTEEEMRDGNYPGSQQRSRELFQSSLALLNKLVVQGHYDEWETGLAMIANPENALERTDLLLRIQARALETWRYGQDGRAHTRRDGEPVTTAPNPFDLGNIPSGRWNAMAELVKGPSDAVSGDVSFFFFFFFFFLNLDQTKVAKWQNNFKIEADSVE